MSQQHNIREVQCQCVLDIYVKVNETWGIVVSNITARVISGVFSSVYAQLRNKVVNKTQNQVGFFIKDSFDGVWRQVENANITVVNTIKTQIRISTINQKYD